MDIRMPRTIVEKEGKMHYEQFPLCTNVGALGEVSDSHMHPNAFDKELGTGVTVYFKLLRYLGLMFLLFTALSVPTYIICGSNGQSNLKQKKTGLGNLLSSFSIGNVGASKLNCQSVKVPAAYTTATSSQRATLLKTTFNQDKVITCPYGFIDGFMEIGLISTNCASRGSDPTLKNKGEVLPECNLALY